MAVIIHPAQAVTFGCPVFAGIYMQQLTIKASANKKEIADNTGELVAIVYSQKKYAINLQGIFQASATSTLSIGNAASSLASLSVGGVSPAGATFVDSIDAAASNSDATRLTVDATSYDTITS